MGGIRVYWARKGEVNQLWQTNRNWKASRRPVTLGPRKYLTELWSWFLKIIIQSGKYIFVFNDWLFFCLLCFPLILFISVNLIGDKLENRFFITLFCIKENLLCHFCRLTTCSCSFFSWLYKKNLYCKKLSFDPIAKIKTLDKHQWINLSFIYKVSLYTDFFSHQITLCEYLGKSFLMTVKEGLQFWAGDRLVLVRIFNSLGVVLV